MKGSLIVSTGQPRGYDPTEVPNTSSFHLFIAEADCCSCRWARMDTANLPNTLCTADYRTLAPLNPQVWNLHKFATRKSAFLDVFLGIHVYGTD
jgi:hypothetical protein